VTSFCRGDTGWLGKAVLVEEYKRYGLDQYGTVV
jgi:hypothetical protein